MKALFRVDASAHMGGGHLMRCLTLADCLRSLGFESTFATRPLPASLHALVEQRHRLHVFSPELPDEAADAPLGWELQPWPDERQAYDADAVQRLFGTRHFDWLVVDHYRLDARWEASMTNVATRICAIDDLVNRKHHCNVLVDQTVDRAAVEYEPLVPVDALVLAGSEFALLRREFAALRGQALARRRAPIERILISLGATDVGGITERALDAVERAAPPHVRIDVVLGSGSPSLERIRARATERILLHVDSTAMAELMARADLAVGAAGTSAWERCCLGLPCVTLVLAENQRDVARRLADRGAAIVVDDINALSVQIRDLVMNPRRCAALAGRAQRVTDGRGATRVAGKLRAFVGPST